MPLETLVVGGTLTVAVGFYFASWLASEAQQAWWPTPGANRKISFLLLVFWTASKSIVFVRRSTPDQLLQEGLNTQNWFQLVAVLALAAWALFLLRDQSVAFRHIAIGPTIWFTGLGTLYLLSVAWSVWPELTALRAVEVLSVTVVGVHCFQHREGFATLERFVIAGVVLGLLGSLLVRGGVLDFATNGFAMLRSNPGGTLAGVLVLLELTRRSRGLHHRLGCLAFALLTLYLFGSLAAIASLTLAAPFLLSGSSSRLARTAVRVAAASVVLVLTFVAPNLEVSDDALTDVAGIFGKTSSHLTTLTGRLPLWEAIWVETMNAPFGGGYSARERLFAIGGFAEARGGWQAFSAHSGYVSGWIGAGWLGILAVFACFGALMVKALHCDRQLRPALASILVLLIVNNIAIAGVGGYPNQVWVVAIALAAVPRSLQAE